MKLNLIGLFLLCIVILLILYFNKSTILTNVAKESSLASRFSPTVFKIYDNPITGECDRLIIIKPFDWYILAKGGRVYILNQTTYDCPQNATPSVLVPQSVNEVNINYEFLHTCLDINFRDIVDIYRNSSFIKEYTLPYDLQSLWSVKDRFTVLDALNYLFQHYITMSLSDAIGENEPFSERTFGRMRKKRSLTDESGIMKTSHIFKNNMKKNYILSYLNNGKRPKRVKYDVPNYSNNEALLNPYSLRLAYRDGYVY